MGPGPVQIWRISGQFGPKNDVISKKKKKKKKKVFTEILTVFPVEIRCSPKKKKCSGFSYWFLSVMSMGPLKPTAFLKPMGPGVILPPAPPLGGPEWL